MSGWPTAKVESLSSHVTVGFVGSMSKLFVDDGVPLLRGQNIDPYRLKMDGLKFISPETHAKWKKSALEPGDVVLVRVGYPGTAAVVPEGIGPLNAASLVIVRPNQNRLNSGYLAYVFNSPWGVGAISGRLVGSAQQVLNTKTVAGLEIPTPPIEAQQRIVAILGAYDDLIEVNRRRVAVLEEMARALFEEWFVRFRFPGHEDVPVVDTPGGPLPDGWEWNSASAVIEFDPRTRVPKEGEKPFISMGLLDTATSLIEPFELRSGNSGAKFQNHDTVFARITPCLENGKTGLVRDLPSNLNIGFGSTEFIVMRGTRAGPAFTYCLARNANFRDHARSSMSGATGRQRARTDSVAAFQLGVPPDDQLLHRFENVAWPMLEIVGRLGKANGLLAASRDLLLPRLISGQLSVEAAERELENAA